MSAAGCEVGAWAQVAVCLRRIGLDSQGSLITQEGLFPLPKGLERQPLIVVGFGVIGFDGQGLTDELNGRFIFPSLMGDHTE